MASVQQTHLHLFIGQHIGRHFRPSVFPSGAAMEEMILDHPLAESLGYDRPSVIDPEFFAYKLAMSIRCRRSDTIHHTVRERAISFQPVSDRGIPELGKGQEHFLGDVPVTLHIVTRHDGERWLTSLSPPIQSLNQISERAIRFLGML